MSRIFEIAVGQTVFITPGGNARRGWDGKEPIEAIVDNIARKYFQVRWAEFPGIKEKFDKETFESKCDDCNSKYFIWETKEAWYSYRDACRELGEIRDWLSRQSSRAIAMGGTLDEQTIHDMYAVLRRNNANE